MTPTLMIIDLQRDTLVPVQTMCVERLGRRVSPQSVWRWIVKGCSGAKLEAVRVSGKWHTTPAAFAAFIEAQTASALPVPEAEEDCRRTEATERRLREAGLL